MYYWMMLIPRANYPTIRFKLGRAGRGAVAASAPLALHRCALVTATVHHLVDGPAVLAEP